MKGERGQRGRRGRTSAAVGLVLVLVCVVGGCGQSLPPTRHYRLSLPVEGVPVGSSLRCPDGRRPVIAVEELEVDAAYDDPRIVYRESEYRLEHYDYHLWGAAPGRLVSDALRMGYASTGRFERVEADWGEGDVDASVRGRLIALEEVDRTPTEWFAHVALQLELVDVRTEERLWSQGFDASRPLRERSPTGLAAAASEVLAQVVRASAPSVAEQLVVRPGGCAGIGR